MASLGGVLLQYFYTSLKATPFKVACGREPPSLQSFDHGSNKVAAVNQFLSFRDELVTNIRDHLLQAQQLYKKYYDVKYRDLEFQVGDWVWLWLLHRHATSLVVCLNNKVGTLIFWAI